MALTLPIPKGTRGVETLPNIGRKVFTLGTLTLGDSTITLVSTFHSDERMTEREARQLETVLAACRALSSSLLLYGRMDELMVNVTSHNLSFVLGFWQTGYIRIITVINKGNATPRNDCGNTKLRTISLSASNEVEQTIH